VSDANNSAGDPHEVWYCFSGREMIYDGNNGAIDTDEATSVNNRTANQGTGAFLNGANSPLVCHQVTSAACLKLVARLLFGC
jgi:hypothetical protein